MQFLIVKRAYIQVFADRANISDHQPLHAFSLQRADQVAGKFVFDILDLVLQCSQLFLFAVDELFASPGARLFAGDSAIQFSFELVLILPFAAQEPPIHDVGVKPIMRNGRVYLAEVNACTLLCSANLIIRLLFLSF
jgi:hypothetical protein